jgi:predicted metal-dependent hydrolase
MGQLSLFDAPDSGSTSAPDPTEPRLPAAIPKLPTPFSPPGSAGSAPVYAHQQADREIRLGDCRVAYRLRRARRKSIGFCVAPEGLTVSAPRWVSLHDIELSLRDKSAWILRKLAEQRERQHRLEAGRIEWRDGATVPYLGESLIVVLDPRAGGAVLSTAAEVLPGLPRLTLHVGLPQAATADQIRDAVQAWLQHEAHRLFTRRCQHFAAQLGVRMTALKLSSAQTRWGSASADGVIRLNWRLIHFGLSVVDYVVVHELAHLREMNHSPAFWDVVRSVLPDVDQRRAQLRSPQIALHD